MFGVSSDSLIRNEAHIALRLQAEFLSENHHHPRRTAFAQRFLPGGSLCPMSGIAGI